jgi:hypothetical protein
MQNYGKKIDPVTDSWVTGSIFMSESRPSELAFVAILAMVGVLVVDADYRMRRLFSTAEGIQ